MKITRTVRIAFVFCLLVVCGYTLTHVHTVTGHAQVATRQGTAATTVTNMHLVAFALPPCTPTNDGKNPCLLSTASGTSPIAGIVQSPMDAPGVTYPAGSAVSICTLGDCVVEFDGPPQSGYTAVVNGAFAHYDPTMKNDSDVCSDVGVLGKIQAMRPDLGPNFATVNFKGSGARGQKQCASSPGLSDAVASLAAQGPVGPQGPKGDTGATGSQGSQGVQGVAGPQGQTGGIGPQGTPGAKGDTGATGVAGPAGPAGPTGATGATGSAGPAGAAGAAGSQGVAGPAGSPGYLSGTSTSVSQSLLTVGATATGTATITGVSAGTPCEAAPTSGAINNGLYVRAWGTAVNTVTVYQTNLVLLSVAPSAVSYNVRCMP